MTVNDLDLSLLKLIKNWEEVEVKLEYSTSLDDEDEMNVSLKGDLFAVKYDSDAKDDELELIEAKCGEFSITIFDEDWHELLEAADMHSQEACNIIEACLANGVACFGRVAILDHIEIHENYQNLKLGTKAIEQIMKYLEKIYKVNFILLKVDESRYTENRLIKFYKQFNFKPIGEDQTKLIYESENNMF